MSGSGWSRKVPKTFLVSQICYKIGAAPSGAKVSSIGRAKRVGWHVHVYVGLARVCVCVEGLDACVKT